MLSVMFIKESVKHYLEVPENFTVALESGLDPDMKGLVRIHISNPHSCEGWSHYSDEVAYVMNDKGQTIAKEYAPKESL